MSWVFEPVRQFCDQTVGVFNLITINCNKVCVEMCSEILNQIVINNPFLSLNKIIFFFL